MVIDNHNLKSNVYRTLLTTHYLRGGLNDNISRHMPSVAEVYAYNGLARALSGNLGAALNAHIQLRARALTVKIRKNNE